MFQLNLSFFLLSLNHCRHTVFPGYSSTSVHIEPNSSRVYQYKPLSTGLTTDTFKKPLRATTPGGVINTRPW